MGQVRNSGRLVLVCVLILTAAWTWGTPPPNASTDRIPPEDWTYDAMSHLAAHGLVPGMTAQRFMGDWLYTRIEMAGFIRDTLEGLSPFVDPDDRALIERLAVEFLPELQFIGVELSDTSVEPYMKHRAVVPSLIFEPRLIVSDGDTELTAIHKETLLGIKGRYITAAATISNRRRKFDGNEFSQFEKYFIRGKTPNWEWEIGKDWLWWGPGYSGSMILSNNSPGFLLIKLSKDVNFGKRIGRVKITQFTSSWQDQGDRFYLLGRRWEKQLSKRFHFGVNETAKLGKAPNPLIYIMPSFYLYQHIFIEDDQEFNVLLSFDGIYSFSPRFEAYVEYLIDDMTAPSFLREGPAWNIPRKTGYLIGAHLRDITGDGTTGLRAEFILTQAGTYGATRPNYPGMAYTHDGFVIGHPVGPNSEAIFLRIDRDLGKNWTGVIEYLDRWPRNVEGPNPEDTSRLSLLLVRDLSTSLSLTARYDSLRLPEKETRFQFGASFAF